MWPLIAAAAKLALMGLKLWAILLRHFMAGLAIHKDSVVPLNNARTKTGKTGRVSFYVGIYLPL